ncbi:ras-associated and pleckstrin homology domains-containing protein 1-like [Chenopodium quinoa]|uniref:ras-associated and pleckstrin homology domains-containing protein 1-like n=1 Tax=Chenopodium quinoa TaxID=63459 RepID=UPI000B78E640|nr:ras-associated and pleckstrin homology domains-containing protein 1-like [Chenopodium quinoa]
MEDGDIPPFWQPPATLTRRNRHRSSSPILNSSLLIILLPSIALLFTVFIIIPSIHKILPITNNTNNTQNQKSISVKKSWDLLNITLVLFAILCGIFAKRNDDPSSITTIERDEHVQQHPTQTRSTSTTTSTTTGSLRRSKTMMHNYNHSSTSVPQWFEYSQQQRITTSPTNTPQPDTGISRLRRTVSSDPYMKYTNNNDNHNNTKNTQFRFFDDLDISRFYPKDEEYKPQLAEATMSPPEFEKTPVKDIGVDNSELRNRGESQSPTFSPPQTPPRNPPAPSPPPPPPPPPAKQRRTFQTIPRREQVPPSPPPPPPPPPPPQMPRGREEKRRSSRKRMNATKEIATAIVHLYSQRKRKRRQKSQKPTRNFEDFSSENRSQFFPPPSPPPPPPPLPPHPSSAFKSWFKKGSKTKKIHSFSSIPKPPPPPIRQKPANSDGKPPLPARRDTGVPPPPPPPPYKVRPEIIDGDEAMSEMNGGDGERVSSVTCPSPDLNVKADSFIARHHDGWRLEKLNSWREKLNKAGNGPTF